MQKLIMDITDELKTVLSALAVGNQGMGPIIEDCLWRVPEIDIAAKSMGLKRQARTSVGKRGQKKYFKPLYLEPMKLHEPRQVVSYEDACGMLPGRKTSVNCVRSNRFSRIELKIPREELFTSMYGQSVVLTGEQERNDGYGLAVSLGGSWLFVETNPGRLQDYLNKKGL